VIDYGLQDKVALVTGAGSGIGAACARALATSPATVALADIDVNAADQLASDLRADGGWAQGFALDVTAPDPVDAVVAAVVAQVGELNIAVNNADIGGAAAVTGDVTTADWSRIMAVNLNGVFDCTRAEINAMRASGGGSIINMASVLGTVAHGLSPAYVAP